MRISHSWSQNGTRETAVDDLLHHFEWTQQQSLFKELQANNKRKHFESGSSHVRMYLILRVL